jgi:hypothetical protein
MAAMIAGRRNLLVRALDAARFYRANEFLVSPIDPLILAPPLATARKVLG